MEHNFAPVDQVGTSPDTTSDLAAWIASAPLAALVTEFGGGPGDLAAEDLAAGDVSLADRFAALDRFSDRWDTRVDPTTGVARERNQADELPLTDSQVDLVLAAADAFGMREVHKPRHAEYDFVFMLGGLVRACLNRPAYAAHLVSTGTVTAKSIVALGGHRPFAGDEPELAAAAGHPDLVDEFGALDRGTTAAFGLREPDEVQGEESDLVGGAWDVRNYHTADGLPVTVAAAPSSDPENRRANTADSYDWFATRFAHVEPGQRVLAITTPIYVNQQHAAALRMLGSPYRVEVETIGNDPELVAPELQQHFSPSKYLMEIRSTVRAFRALLDSLDG
ncbi:hypothetical protein AB0I60_25310 [Actinosynnema sp. NPDC050436]|uniref:hypothetical protein n=1 Tax=Actinosynnema sp. NPDC050436 TaxID=3155659 RepID=UPI0033FB0E63